MSPRSDTDHDPDGEYLVGGAALGLTHRTTVSEAVSRLYPDEYDHLRSFQHAVGKWLQRDTADAPVGALAAPTGAGKTAAIAAVAKQNDSTIVIYPTNALVNDQSATLRDEFNLNVTVVTGETLTRHGDERSQELLAYAQDPATDVLVTNPDVPQAIVQDMYFSPGDRLMEFYAEFDAAVYDEFHYYDPLAATGLLMQIKFIIERGQYLDRQARTQHPKILLSSATPDKEFIQFIRDDLPIDVGVDLLSAGVAPADIGEALHLDAEGVSEDFIYDTLGSAESVPDWTNPASDTTVTDTQPRSLTGATAPQNSEAPDDTTEAGTTDLSRFRYPMRIFRFGDRITDADDFDLVIDRLRQSIGHDGSDGQAAVIFDSAARSNRFYNYLVKNTGALGEGAIKDNGYDTAADVERDTSSFTTYVTTSKGEVGLNYDLDRLVMTKPYSATQFIQRIGRAARQSPATVDVFGLKEQSWPTIQSYPGFIRRVAATMPDPATDRSRLQNLIGLRAARALRVRYGTGYGEDLKQALDELPMASRWRRTLRELDEAFDAADGGGLFSATYKDRTWTALDGARAAVKGLDSLRGQSTTADISYPRGGQRVETEYSLDIALTHYNILTVDDSGVIHLGSKRSDGPVSAIYPGEPMSGDGIDLLRPSWEVSTRLTEEYTAAVDDDDLREMDDNPLDSDGLTALLRTLPLRSLLRPDSISTPHAEVQTDETGGVESVSLQTR